MKVKKLIEYLQKCNPEHDVVVSGNEFGIGSDVCLDNAHQYDDTTYVTLITGDSFEEGEETC
jgi:hypothetical protein